MNHLGHVVPVQESERRAEKSVAAETQEPFGETTAETDQVLQAPEIQTMYSLNLPVSTLRTKMRQEFERHRYVNQMKTVDVLLFNSHQEYQETLNFWKQLSHVLKYFRAEEDPKARLPANFINGFLEVSRSAPNMLHAYKTGSQLTLRNRDVTEQDSEPGARSKTTQTKRVNCLSNTISFLVRRPDRMTMLSHERLQCNDPGVSSNLTRLYCSI